MLSPATFDPCRRASCRIAIPLGLALAIAGCALQGYERVTEVRAAAPGAFTVVQAVCPAGKRVLGGGFQISGSPGDLNVAQSFPQETTDTAGDPALGWQVAVTSQAASALDVVAFATCAR